MKQLIGTCIKTRDGVKVHLSPTRVTMATTQNWQHYHSFTMAQRNNKNNLQQEKGTALVQQTIT